MARCRRATSRAMPHQGGSHTGRTPLGCSNRHAHVTKQAPAPRPPTAHPSDAVRIPQEREVTTSERVELTWSRARGISWLHGWRPLCIYQGVEGAFTRGVQCIVTSTKPCTPEAGESSILQFHHGLKVGSTPMGTCGSLGTSATRCKLTTVSVMDRQRCARG